MLSREISQSWDVSLTCQFDLNFTKGNTIVAPNKLMFLQKRYATEFAEENGIMFESMVEAVLAAARLRVDEPPQ